MLALRGIVSAGPRRPVGDRALGARRALLAARPRRMHRATTVTRRPPVRARRCCRASCASTLALAPGAEETIVLRYELHEGPEPAPEAPRPAAARRARRSRTSRLDERTSVESDDQLFNRVLRALAARHPDAALAPRRRRLLRGGRAVVRDAVRARLPDHGDADARRSTRRWRRRRCACWPACSARRDDPEHDEEPGKVHPRAARRRDRAARPHAARALLRHRRRDAAVPLPARASTRTGPATSSLFHELRGRGRRDARLDRRPG